jgi:hypothetical protein
VLLLISYAINEHEVGGGGGVVIVIVIATVMVNSGGGGNRDPKELQRRAQITVPNSLTL